MSEKLHTSPNCQTPNFTERGLKAHKCKGPKLAIETPAKSRATTVAVEVMPAKPKQDPAWDNARLYFRAFKATSRENRVAQICLGWELSNKKKELGFMGAGRRPVIAQVGQLTKTWQEYLHKNIDPNLTRQTADRFIDVFEGFKEKVPKKLLAGFTATAKRSLLTTLSKPPTTLTAKERETIEVAIMKCSDGETQQSLLEELNLVKVHKALTGGDTSGSPKKKKPTDAELMGQLAFKFFEPIAEGLQAFRTDKDRDAFLATLELHSSEEGAITLTTLEADLEAALETVRSVKKAKLKNTAKS